MQINLGRRFWITTTVIVVLFTLVFIGQNLLHALRIRSEVKELEREKASFQERIAADSAFVEQLRYDDYLEEYAREELHMQGADERVFVIE
ncbi:MAG: septum formation initiator family protein [Alistipes sp.]|nr:septum formation initiator [Rikenellaceae bacterium]MBR1994220.1 septum formation initiator family protein [Alistipes sp.]